MSTLAARKFLAVFQIAIFASGSAGFARPLAAGKIGASQVRDGELLATAPIQTDPPMARREHIEGLRNFAEITPTLYRGGQPTPQGWRNLAKMGVTIVVNLRLTRRAHEHREVTELGMRYIEIPWLCVHPTDADMARFLAVLRQNPGQKIFVHCFTGDDRTGMEIAAFRMAEQGWTAEQARKEMAAFGFNFVHRGICPRLGAYETRFPQRLAISPAFQNLRAQIVLPDPDSDPAQHR